jgi:hypothetical protein
MRWVGLGGWKRTSQVTVLNVKWSKANEVQRGETSSMCVIKEDVDEDVDEEGLQLNLVCSSPLRSVKHLI